MEGLLTHKPSEPIPKLYGAPSAQGTMVSAPATSSNVQYMLLKKSQEKPVTNTTATRVNNKKMTMDELNDRQLDSPTNIGSYVPTCQSNGRT